MDIFSYLATGSGDFNEDYSEGKKDEKTLNDHVDDVHDDDQFNSESPLALTAKSRTKSRIRRRT